MVATRETQGRDCGGVCENSKVGDKDRSRSSELSMELVFKASKERPGERIDVGYFPGVISAATVVQEWRGQERTGDRPKGEAQVEGGCGTCWAVRTVASEGNSSGLAPPPGLTLRGKGVFGSAALDLEHRHIPTLHSDRIFEEGMFSFSRGSTGCTFSLVASLLLRSSIRLV